MAKCTVENSILIQEKLFHSPRSAKMTFLEFRLFPLKCRMTKIKVIKLRESE